MMIVASMDPMGLSDSPTLFDVEDDVSAARNN
jgi:hypothetical protein